MASAGMVPFKEINPRNRKIPVTPFFLQLGGQPKAMPIDYDQLRMSRQLQISQFSNPSVVQNVFIQALIPLTTKGDLLGHDGNSNNVRIPVGSRDRAVIADPDNANGVRWSDKYWVYNKFRRELSIQTQMNGVAQFTGWTYTGGFAAPSAYTADADGVWFNYTTSAALNNNLGQYTIVGNGEFCRTAQLPAVHWKMKTGAAATDIQNVRMWFLVFDSGPGVPWALQDTPLFNCFGFRFSTAAGDTTWAFYNSNGVTSTQTINIGPTVTADTVYKLSCVFTGSSILLYINDTFVTTVTLNLPNTGIGFVPGIGICNLTAGAGRNMKWEKTVCNQE